MKKKVISIILGSLMAMSLAACDAIKIEIEPTEMSISEADHEQSSDETKQTEQAEQTEQTKQTEQAKTDEQAKKTQQTELNQKDEPAENYILKDLNFSDHIYVINRNGNLIKQVDRDTLLEKAKEKGMDLSDASLECASDGVIFLTKSDGENGDYRWNLYAVDLNTWDIESIWNSEDYLADVNYYKGKLYLNSYNNQDGSRKPEESVFVKKTGVFEFTEEKVDIQSILKAVGDSEIITATRNDITPVNRMSVSECLERCGYLLAKDGAGQYRMIYKDGSFEDVELTNSDSNILDFDDDYILFRERIEDDYWQISYYDLFKQSSSVLVDKTSEFSWICYEDGDVYLYKDRGTEFNVEENAVYRVDLDGESIYFLYEEKDIPGVSIAAGVSGFRVIGENIYVLDFDQGKIKWATININPYVQEIFRPELNDTEYVNNEITAFQYGTVDCVTAKSVCAKCGTTVKELYGENFILAEKYSANVVKINKQLRDHLKNIKELPSEVEPENDESCEYHKGNPQSCDETQVDLVTNVKIINDKYLLVYYNGYWYGGGVHGMPIRYQYMFDLITGDEMKIKDFYQGTEEDFKKLVAEKTKEDYLAEPGRYLRDSEDKVYEDAYKDAGIESSNVEFEEEGINILYAPYAMGPYAAGYMTVFISYEELLGRSGLDVQDQNE